MAASILSAPGSLAFSKLLYPETKKSQLKEVKDLELEKPWELYRFKKIYIFLKILN